MIIGLNDCIGSTIIFVDEAMRSPGLTRWFVNETIMSTEEL